MYLERNFSVFYYVCSIKSEMSIIFALLTASSLTNTSNNGDERLTANATTNISSTTTTNTENYTPTTTVPTKNTNKVTPSGIHTTTTEILPRSKDTTEDKTQENDAT